MTLYISPEDQKTVDSLRIALSQAGVDLTEVFTHDVNSQKKRSSVLEQLDQMRKQMDALGLVHTMAGKRDSKRTVIEFLGTGI